MEELEEQSLSLDLKESDLIEPSKFTLASQIRFLVGQAIKEQEECHHDHALSQINLVELRLAEEARKGEQSLDLTTQLYAYHNFIWCYSQSGMLSRQLEYAHKAIKALEDFLVLEDLKSPSIEVLLRKWELSYYQLIASQMHFMQGHWGKAIKASTTAVSNMKELIKICNDLRNFHRAPPGPTTVFLKQYFKSLSSLMSLGKSSIMKQVQKKLFSFSDYEEVINELGEMEKEELMCFTLTNLLDIQPKAEGQYCIPALCLTKSCRRADLLSLRAFLPQLQLLAACFAQLGKTTMQLNTASAEKIYLDALLTTVCCIPMETSFLTELLKVYNSNFLTSAVKGIKQISIELPKKEPQVDLSVGLFKSKQVQTISTSSENFSSCLSNVIRGKAKSKRKRRQSTEKQNTPSKKCPQKKSTSKKRGQTAQNSPAKPKVNSCRKIQSYQELPCLKNVSTCGQVMFLKTNSKSASKDKFTSPKKRITSFHEPKKPSMKISPSQGDIRIKSPSQVDIKLQSSRKINLAGTANISKPKSKDTKKIDPNLKYKAIPALPPKTKRLSTKKDTRTL